ncbi:allantoinase [Paenibacillus sp. UNC496MF]|uniref:allantoinase AllB n=1 Tax=Paenibacillus sp. UNC496MF TaxID=1502753 RepID=UPI0008E115F4|nr:allantoinase AllB [Paenibacillus sp. UNC496MF]SFI35803.1 allantoinase [Paenibacillus sp. UNC496MF]
MTDTRWDLLVKGGTVVLRDRTAALDIAVKDGKIAAIAAGLPSDGAVRTLSAAGRHVFAGVVDAHVHLNEPGLGEWEGFATGSAALAAGGCTTFIDMPLNGLPPTVNKAALELKLAAARQSGVRVDYALWGGLVPGNLGDLAALAEAGVVGFKAFMSSPGDTGDGCFANVDDGELFAGMRAIAALNGILALHAESEPIVSRLAAGKQAAGETSMRDFLASRPPEAELEAVKLALEMASRTGCSLHFVHISTPEAIGLIGEAKRAGLDVTAETCPHYLVFADDDAARIGVHAKCAPPIRGSREREALWELLADGKIDFVASDHSPCPPAMKETADGNVFAAWGGIMGAQSTLEAIVTEGWLKRGIPLPVLSRALSAAPAERFGLAASKGAIAVGLDADLALVDLQAPYVLTADQLKYRHPRSAYEGFGFGCRVESTLLRGAVVYDRRADRGGLDTERQTSGRRLRPRGEKSRIG